MAEAATLGVVSTSTQVSELTTYYAKWAAGTGLIPVPIVDLAAVTAVQLKMLRRLAKIHGVDYDDSSGKCLIGALLGAIVPAKLGYASAGSLVKMVPIVGPLVGIVVTPAFNYASTLAVGRVFNQHFAAGGTLFTFDTDATREHFRQEFEKAKEDAPAE